MKIELQKNKYNCKIIKCKCGAEIRNDSIRKHNKSIKHIEFIESEN